MREKKILRKVTQIKLKTQHNNSRREGTHCTAAVWENRRLRMREKHRAEASLTEGPMSQELRSKEENERERGGTSRWHLHTPSDTKKTGGSWQSSKSRAETEL